MKHTKIYGGIATDSELRGSGFDPHLSAMLCSWARHVSFQKYWCIPRKQWPHPEMKILDWDLKPQNKEDQRFIFNFFFFLLDFMHENGVIIHRWFVYKNLAILVRLVEVSIIPTLRIPLPHGARVYWCPSCKVSINSFYVRVRSFWVSNQENIEG